MATQRLMVATVAGEAGAAVKALARAWLGGPTPDPAVVDGFCERLLANGAALPVVYFCEWVDRWLMGDLVPGPGTVEGGRYQVACLTPAEAVAWADRCRTQFPEQGRLAARLREAAEGWGSVAEPLAVVVVREVLGPSTTDDEVRAALRGVPAWLSDEQSTG
jgi:hypothetical protein